MSDTLSRRVIQLLTPGPHHLHPAGVTQDNHQTQAPHPHNCRRQDTQKLTPNTFLRKLLTGPGRFQLTPRPKGGKPNTRVGARAPDRALHAMRGFQNL